MKCLAPFLLIALLSTFASAEIIIYNGSGEAYTYTATSETGRSSEGDIAKDGKHVSHTLVSGDYKKRCKLSIKSASGEEVAGGDFSNHRILLLRREGDALKLDRIGWYLNTGENRPRFVRLFNHAKRPLKVDVVTPSTVLSREFKHGDLIDVAVPDTFDSQDHLNVVLKKPDGTTLVSEKNVIGAGHTFSIADDSWAGGPRFQFKDLGVIATPTGWSD